MIVSLIHSYIYVARCSAALVASSLQPAYWPRGTRTTSASQSALIVFRIVPRPQFSMRKNDEILGRRLKQSAGRVPVHQNQWRRFSLEFLRQRRQPVDAVDFFASNQECGRPNDSGALCIRQISRNQRSVFVGINVFPEPPLVKLCDGCYFF